MPRVPAAAAKASWSRVFPATRAQAFQRLEEFLPHAGKAYASRRNFHGDTTSRLSPAIRRKLISESEVVGRVMSAHGAVRAEKFIQEVCWRTYWVGWLQQRPGIWGRFRENLGRFRGDSGGISGLKQAETGTTGIDFFDDSARQLVKSGWLHNHVRMNFASIWVFTLGLPWELGADFFYRHLLDACPAANTLSWRWVAGLQTPGKTYLARAETIRDMSGGKFRLDVPLAREAQALAADVIPAPRPIAPAERADMGVRTGLFLTTADLSVETLDLPRLVAVAATSRIGGNPAALKRAHAERALADGLARAGAFAGVAPERLDEEAPIEAMRDWVARHGLKQVVTGEAPVGPEADRLAVLAGALAQDGVRLVRLRRRWDDLAWPMAGKGFFAFKAGIPKLLAG